MIYTALKSLVAALLLSSIAVAHTVYAKQSQQGIDDTITSTVPAAQREAIASAALRALRHITQARNAIHNNNLAQARQDVQRARELLTLMEAARPAARLKEHIWVARQHMAYETAEDIIDDLTLIDAELLSLGDTMPTARARRHLEAAQALMMKNDVKAAQQELDRLEASLMFTEFDLPLAACRHQILAAQEELTADRPDAADRNLVAAEESIQFISLGGGAALAGARTHLSDAEKNYHDEYFAAAAADLAQASEWLRRTGKNADDKRREEAQKLAEEIDALKDRLETREADHANTLSAFLYRSVALIEREAEDLWLRYTRQRAANHTLRKLLDAKIHLYYANIGVSKGRHTESIRKELESTDRYLEEALTQAQPTVRERIEQLREEIHGLEQDLDGDRKQLKGGHAQALADLIQLIHDH